MTNVTDYWDAMASELASIEDNYLNPASINKIISEINAPVLVVGAGQGIIVEELRNHGLKVDGVDLSSEMVRHAKIRRNLELIQADATNMPFKDNFYATTIIATGVIDFMTDEVIINKIIQESMRITANSGKLFIAFYKLSDASENWLKDLRLLNDGTFQLRQSLETYCWTSKRLFDFLRQRLNLGYSGGICKLIKLQLIISKQDRKLIANLRKLFKTAKNPQLILDKSPEILPYRNKDGIKDFIISLGYQLIDFMISNLALSPKLK